eukprot:CAMPEP_0114561314 /NCGR_PEP_ID=MMETSP0114-20121206/11938_1 /TAXON_ID=31324 /ORGANISM="Goniomonas sp, Strain m" /LENGTH=45 /DNA_ID= /DNA_START= /DNA_END= /DNA_ORIENTATION=
MTRSAPAVGGPEATAVSVAAAALTTRPLQISAGGAGRSGWISVGF